MIGVTVYYKNILPHIPIIFEDDMEGREEYDEAQTITRVDAFMESLGIEKMA